MERNVLTAYCKSSSGNGVDNKIAFLDTLVTRKPDGKLLTNSQVYIENPHTSTSSSPMIRTTHNLLNAVFSSVYMTELNASPSHPEQPRRKKHLSTVLVANGYPPSLLKKVTKTRNPTPERETAEFKSTAVMPYIKEVPEPFRRHLQQQEIRTVFKSDITLRSRLVRQKDPADPNKQDDVVYKIRCTCGKVYIGETGRSMQERMKEHDSDI